MDIYKVFEDSRIKMLENDIALWNDHCRYTDEEKHVMKQLLRRRSNVLYELNVYDSDMHQLLVSFNDRLRKACAELYSKVMTTYEEYCNRTDSLGDFEVEGKIYLGAEYPKHHPLQTETTKQVWDALTQGGLNLSMMTAVHGRYIAVKNILLNMVDVKRLRNGLAWKTRTTTGTRDLTGNGQNTCT